jgi:hypothetical protein
MHLGIICDHFVKRILTPVRAQLAKLGDRTNRFGIKLGVVYEKCEAEKKEFVKLQHANNIVPISRRHTSEIAGESEDHAKDILSKNTITALRDLYRNQEAPLQLFESTEPEELVARVDRSFASLSQRLINNFHIGREVVDHLQQKIQGLVLSSVPYIETDTVWQPMKCNRSPNLLFTPDQETGNKLEELTRSDLMGSKYDPMESPLEHFAIFYQETPGLAISDLALAQAGQTSLDTDERSPRMCTNFLHKNGEASISLKLLEDSGPALQWINAMRYLKPSLFKTINDKFYIQYPGEMGMKQDLFVDDPASLRACLTTFGMDGLQKLFAVALKEDGKEAIIQRMETKMSQAASHDERKLLQAFHAVILKTVF